MSSSSSSSRPRHISALGLRMIEEHRDALQHHETYLENFLSKGLAGYSWLLKRRGDVGTLEDGIVDD